MTKLRDRAAGTCEAHSQPRSERGGAFFTDRPSSKKLSGTCGTKIDIEIDSWTEYEEVVRAVEDAMEVHASNRYPGGHIYIIAGNADYAVAGEDYGEVILSADTNRTYRDEGIKGAAVVYIIK